MTIAPVQPRTLKAFKAMFALGARFEVVDHWIERYRGTVRVVTKQQTIGYQFKREGEMDAAPSHSPYPKRSEVTFHDDGTFTVRPADLTAKGGFWTLRPLPYDPSPTPAPVSAPPPAPLSRTEAMELAKRKSRYGHRDWIVWSEGDEGKAEQITADGVRRAIKAGRFTLVKGGNTFMSVAPPMAEIMASNLDAGWYTHGN